MNKQVEFGQQCKKSAETSREPREATAELRQSVTGTKAKEVFRSWYLKSVPGSCPAVALIELSILRSEFWLCMCTSPGWAGKSIKVHSKLAKLNRVNFTRNFRSKRHEEPSEGILSGAADDLWWPAQMGLVSLHTLDSELSTGEVYRDARKEKFPHPARFLSTS